MAQRTLEREVATGLSQRDILLAGLTPRNVLENVDRILKEEKPYTRPKSWRRPNVIGRLTLSERINEVAIDTALAVTPGFRRLVDLGWGKETQGETHGREGEDMTTKIDLKAEEFGSRASIKSARKHGITISILSEHVDSAITNDPDVVVVRDPIDNTDPLEKGHQSINQFFVDGYFSRRGETKGKQTGAICCNLVNGHVFINMNGKNYEYNPNTGETNVLPSPKKIYSIKDKDFKLTTYGGKFKYSDPFNANFRLLDRDRPQIHEKHPIAGSHLYGESFATGATSAYIMFGEPIAELAQGLAFARDAGYIIASVDPETGEWKEYEFDLEFYLQNPDRYREDRVPMLVVASTKELLHEIIKYGFSKNLSGMDSSPDVNHGVSRGESSNPDLNALNSLKVVTMQDVLDNSIKPLDGFQHFFEGEFDIKEGEEVPIGARRKGPSNN